MHGGTSINVWRTSYGEAPGFPSPIDLEFFDNILIYFVAATSSFFDVSANTVFISTIALSVIRYTNVAIGAINELYFRGFFERLSAVASVSKSYTMWASRVSLMTSLCNTSNITWSTEL